LNPHEEAKPSNRIIGEKIRCIGRRLGKPRLIHYTHAHRALMIDVEGYPAVAEVVKEWRIRRSASNPSRHS